MREIDVKPALESLQVSNINHLTVKLVVADPPDACTSLVNKIAEPPQDAPRLDVYYLIKGSGRCSYAKKVENVKRAYGYGAVIIESKMGLNNLKYWHSEK